MSAERVLITGGAGFIGAHVAAELLCRGHRVRWWATNRACMEAMLRSCGLEPQGSPGHEIQLARRAAEAQPPGELLSVLGLGAA